MTKIDNDLPITPIDQTQIDQTSSLKVSSPSVDMVSSQPAKSAPGFFSNVFDTLSNMLGIGNNQTNGIPQLEPAAPLDSQNAKAVMEEIDLLHREFTKLHKQFTEVMNRDPSEADELTVLLLIELFQNQRQSQSDDILDANYTVAENQRLAKKNQQELASVNQSLASTKSVHNVIGTINSGIDFVVKLTALGTLISIPFTGGVLPLAQGAIGIAAGAAKFIGSTSEAYVDHKLRGHQVRSFVLEQSGNKIEINITIALEDIRKITKSMAQIAAMVRDVISRNSEVGSSFARF